MILGASVLVGACGTSSSGAGEGSGVPTVVVTTTIWADVVSNVACGDLVEIQTVIPPGSDPHAFEPSLRDRERMENATLVVANGLLLEEGLLDTLDAIEESGSLVFEMADHIDSLGVGHGHEDEHEDEDEHNDEDEHIHAGGDPHIWFDPVRVSGALPALGDALVEAAALDPVAVDRCVTDYQATLEAVDASITNAIATIEPSDRKLVTNHDSLGYFADRYGFTIVGTVIPSSSSLAEANPAQLEELAELIDVEGVAAIFAETQQSTDDADALAERLGDVEVVLLATGTLEDSPTGPATYVELLEDAAQGIVSGLSGRP